MKDRGWFGLHTSIWKIASTHIVVDSYTTIYAPMLPLMIPPLGIATRRSTEVTAVDDPLVARACQLIREKACEGLTVLALTRSLGVSKTLFYARFKKALNRLPQEEIVRTKLERAQSLLRQTRLSVAEIAGRSGFTHPEYLNVAFKRVVGVTPGTFRRKQQSE